MVRRREFLGTPLLLAVSCADQREDEQMSGPNALNQPWHMWGNSQIVTIEGTGANFQAVSQQLAKISYRRPDTWSFMLAAKILDGPVHPVLQQLFEVRFSVITGIGRSLVEMGPPNQPFATVDTTFARFNWTVPATVTPGRQANNSRWITQVLAPPVDDGAPTVRQIIDSFPAQDIQCSAAVYIQPATLGRVTFELGAFFAPRSHVRPDWFVESFAGETGGT